MAQKREVRRIEEQAAEAVRRALPEEFVREIEGRDPEAVKRKKIEGSFGLQGYDAPDDVWYARARAIESSEKAMEDSEGRGLIEGEQIQETGEDGSGDGVEKVECEEAGGILSSSTLAALKGYSLQGGGNVKPKAAAGPLVGYGSDEDDDDSD